jgi:hypothetical protein
MPPAFKVFEMPLENLRWAELQFGLLIDELI